MGKAIGGEEREGEREAELLYVVRGGEDDLWRGAVIQEEREIGSLFQPPSLPQQIVYL